MGFRQIAKVRRETYAEADELRKLLLADGAVRVRVRARPAGHFDVITYKEVADEQPEAT